MKKLLLVLLCLALLAGCGGKTPVQTTEPTYYVCNRMLDRTYPQKSMDLLNNIAELERALRIPHAEIEGAW